MVQSNSPSPPSASLELYTQLATASYVFAYVVTHLPPFPPRPLPFFLREPAAGGVTGSDDAGGDGGAGLRGGRGRWAADEEAAAAVVEEEAAAAAGVGSLGTRAGMVGGLDPPGRRRFQKGFDWRNLWSNFSALSGLVPREGEEVRRACGVSAAGLGKLTPAPASRPPAPSAGLGSELPAAVASGPAPGPPSSLRTGSEVLRLQAVSPRDGSTPRAPARMDTSSREDWIPEPWRGFPSGP
uniref:Uncharacterized protein n=1 Tax=Molossus molossus TaxID=27622 RepID=A0A7J8J0N8_MOLMO|nr:hypothetical protein HJG59_010435 [Molossus molossus]